LYSSSRFTVISTVKKQALLAGAGNGLGLTGGYSSPSIVNHRCDLRRCSLWKSWSNRSSATTDRVQTKPAASV